MPEIVAPAAPAAPSAPVTAAPSAPAPVAPAPPATPTAPAAPPSAATPAGAPGPATPPAKYDSATAAAPPDKSAYPDTAAGMDQFIADAGAWNLQHPDEANKLRTERFGEEDAEVETPAESIAAAVAEAEKPEGTEPAKPAEAAAPATPAAIEKWTSTSPELKAAFEKNPGLQAEIMEMARQNEAAAPVLEIVSTKEEAQFAVEHAQRLVGVQANWMLAAEDPDMIGPAYEQTVDFFKERDQNGAEILVDGKPKMGADFPLFQRSVATPFIESFLSPVQAQITALEAKLQGSYPNDQARDADEKALEDAKYEKAAYDFMLAKIRSAGEPESQLPALPANATPEQVAYQERLKKEREELDAKQGKQGTESRKAARIAIDRAVDQHFTKTINDHIDSYVAQMKERGEYLPPYVLEDKFINPITKQATKVSDLGARMWLALNAKIDGNPIHKAKMASLQAMGKAGEEARKAELTRLTNLYLPKLLDARIKEIQDGIRGASGKKPAAAAGSVARVEPQSQSTIQPQSMSDTQLRTWAETEAAKDPTFKGLNTQQREEVINVLKYQKKYGG